MSINRLQVAPDSDDVFACEQPEAVVEIADVIHEFEIGVQHDDAMNGLRQHSMDGDGKEEQSVTVVGAFLKAEVLLHWHYDRIQVAGQFVNIQFDYLKT